MVYHLTHLSHPLLYDKKLLKGRRCHLLLSDDPCDEDAGEDDDDEKDDAGEDSMIGGIGDSSH